VRQLEIIHTSVYRDCEQCGGNSAEGARVELDGKVIVDLVPVPHCFGGTTFNEADTTQAILRALGITDVEVSESYND
jgi:hypothetical protein